MSLTFANQALVRMSFPGARFNSEPQGEGDLEARSHYYLGDSRTWRSAAHFQRIRYREIYPGIDLVFLTKSGNLEYNFEIAPKADPSRIKIRYRRARLALGSDGALTIDAAGVEFEQARPHAFQLQSGQSHSIACDYVVQPTGLVRIRPISYDRNVTLVIDPLLNFSTLVGGPGFDTIQALATDASGNLYVTGSSSSETLTGGPGPVRSRQDAFVAKLSNAGTLVYAVFVGGSGNDSGQGIAVDSQGNAYVTGVTASTNFPATSGVLSTHLTGPQNAFVFKVNPRGSLQYSTYLGGGGADSALAIAVDASTAVYVAGSTTSTGFPVTPGAVQVAYGGGLSDCFVSKLNATATALVYSTFLGGSAFDSCSGIAIDTADNAYVTGTTYSLNYPTEAPLRNALGGTATAFVSEINSAGSALAYSTFLGGTTLDKGDAIAVDAAGAAYVAGTTASADFPTTSQAFQTSLNGLYNAFVSKISPGGGSLVYSTLIGGSSTDSATSIALDQLGRAVIGGFTTSTNFPVFKAIQTAFAGSFDAFAAVLNPQGTGLVFSSYFGGSGDDRAYAAGAIPAAQLYLTGTTSSSNFATLAAFDTQSAPSDGFALQVTYVVRELILQQDSTTEVAQWLLGGPQGSTYESWDWLSAGLMTDWSLVGMADFNGDGILDMIWQLQSTGQVAVWYMGGPQGNVYESWGWLSAGNMLGWTFVGAVDFNGDGHPDLIWQNQSTGQVAVWYMGGPLGNVYQSWAWLAARNMTGLNLVGAADFNGDGHPDLVWQYQSTGQVAVWYMGGPLGNVYQSWNWLSSGMMTGWTVSGIVDLNSDGHSDLIWQNATSRQITAWFMGGQQGDVVLSTLVSCRGLLGWTVKGCY